MTGDSRAVLRRALETGYGDLKLRLSRYLGSTEMASDALQETYVRLSSGGSLAPVRNPTAYLFRMATHVALRSLKKDSREKKDAVSLDDAKAAFQVADDAPGPYKALESRVEIELFRQAVDELTPRRRDILFASRIEGIPLREIARRLGVSQRLVEMELKCALAHCAQRLDREVVRRFGPGAVSASNKHRPASGKDE